MNSTIKQNILFGKDYDHKLFRKCIEICDLAQEIEGFIEKEDYQVGLNGNNLSGGQRMRVCICRSIYQQNNLYLFDDIFSSLDSEVVFNIYENIVN